MNKKNLLLLCFLIVLLPSCRNSKQVVRYLNTEYEFRDLTLMANLNTFDEVFTITYKILNHRHDTENIVFYFIIHFEDADYRAINDDKLFTCEISNGEQVIFDENNNFYFKMDDVIMTVDYSKADINLKKQLKEEMFMVDFGFGYFRPGPVGQWSRESADVKDE